MNVSREARKLIAAAIRNIGDPDGVASLKAVIRLREVLENCGVDVIDLADEIEA
jgi:hypothetical protein